MLRALSGPPGDQRQQAPICSSERIDRHRPRQRRPQQAIVGGMPEAGPERAAEPLRGKRRGLSRRRAPPGQRRDHPQIGGDENPERRDQAEFDDEQAAERRTNRAAQIVADAVRCDRPGDLGLRHQERQDRQPGGRVQRPGRAEDERGHEQQNRRSEIERDHGGENRHQRGDRVGDRDDHAPRIDDIGDRARGKSEEEHRQHRRRVHQRHLERVDVERRHQPARRRVIHRNAEESARARHPNDRERRMGEGAKPGRRVGCGFLGDVEVHLRIAPRVGPAAA